MRPSAHVIPIELQRGADAAARTPERRDAVVQRLVAQVPLRSRVLEIGCGNGVLARELAARRGARVTAIDVAPRSIDVARLRTSTSLGIEYCVADFMELSPRGFDVVIAVDVMDALPLTVAVERMANAVVPGGLVLIADRLGEGAAVGGLFGELLGRVFGRVPAELRRALRGAMSGATVRRHLGGRYSSTWRKPRDHGAEP